MIQYEEALKPLVRKRIFYEIHYPKSKNIQVVHKDSIIKYAETYLNP